MSQFADWLTKEQAAEKVGVSTKTIEREAARRRLQRRIRSRPGGSPIAVYDPAGVERMASERRAVDGEVLPTGEVVPYVLTRPDAVGTPTPTAISEEQLQALIDSINRKTAPALPAASADRAPESVPLAQKPRVTLREAVQLGYRADDLVALVKAGKLENVGTPRRYRFRRRDLDAL
jgi:hypothetical protein